MNRFVMLAALILIMPFSAFCLELYADFNQRCIDAQNSIFTLELENASKLLTEEQTENPENVTTDYLWVIHDLLKVLVSESPESFKNFQKRAVSSIKKLEKYKAKDAYGNFYKQEIYFYASVVQGKSGNAVSAANEIRLSYKYGQKVITDYPNFLPAYKTLGLIHAGFGNLPSTYRKLVSMLGYVGTTDRGIQELTKFIDSDTSNPGWVWMKKEASLYLAAVQLYLKNDQISAWSLVDSLTSTYTNNPLFVFVRANFADKCKKNDELINTLKASPTGDQYESVPHFDLLLGTAKQQRLDPDASTFLLRYLTSYKGDSYIKSCYQKLAWNALIINDLDGYNTYMNNLKLKGNLNLEEDQQAQMEANRNELPDGRLLKARLLFDGGYYNKALDEIRTLKASDFATTSHKTEYCYRKARIYHLRGEFILAEAYYKAAILTGEKLSLYYSSYAALYMAEMYEDQDNLVMANLYFRKATSFKSNKEYRKSIEHRAKAGLQRLQ
jgi:hypothetical protein